MAVLLALDFVGNIRRATRCHRWRPGNARPSIAFDGANIDRHRQLLEQQAEERNQRNPATVAAAKRHQFFLGDEPTNDQELPYKLTLRTMDCIRRR